MKPLFSMNNREALYWKNEGEKVRCQLCPHRCLLGNNQRGLCHSRVNIHGHMIAESYNRPCAIAVDPIEKKPLLHFLPGTLALSVAAAGCNFRCRNCQNAEISQSEPEAASSQNVTAEELVNAAQRNGYPTLAYTYTEPLTFYEYMLDTATLATASGLRNVMISAGYVENAPLRRLCHVLDAANIDLKCFDDALYHHQCNGSLSPVLETLETLKAENVWLEITNLLIPSFNDSEKLLSEMCHWLANNGFERVPLHFSRFFPMYHNLDLSVTPLSTLLRAKETALDCGLKHVYVGNVSEYDGENTMCPSCGKLLIRRKGFTVIRNILQDGHCPHCGTQIEGIWK
jgi:pyruvate formate lyase activating enzyme